MTSFFKKTVLILISILFFSWLSAILILKFETHEYYQATPEQKAQAAKYLEGKVTPVPPNWQWRMFSPEPGIALRTGSIDADNAKGTVILVPGWTGFAELGMRSVVAVNNAGYRVAYIEYRGQGKSTRLLSNPEKGHVESYEARAKDVAAFAETVRIDGKPLFFFSESMGAHISMRMAIEESIAVDAYALLVPMIKIKTGTIDYSHAKLLANTLSALGLSGIYSPGQSQWPDLPLVFGKAHDCNSNPQTAQRQSAFFTLDETLRTKGATIGMMKQTAASTDILLSAGYMDTLTQPVKMFTAGIDTLVSTQVSQQFCDSLNNCEVTHFPGARHCISGEDEQRMDGIVAETIQFFDRHIDQNSPSSRTP